MIFVAAGERFRDSKPVSYAVPRFGVAVLVSTAAGERFRVSKPSSSAGLRFWCSRSSFDGSTQAF